MATIAYTDKVDRPAKADQPAKAHYEILVELKEVSENNYEVVVPHMPKPLELGKTVHYKSKAGVVTIKFPYGSPYDNPDGTWKIEVSSDDPPLELKRRGQFPSRCYITFGWGKKPDSRAGAKTTNAKPDDPDTGGANHDVR
jgi:hypothetical protein